MPTPTRPHLQIVPLLGQVYTNHRTPSGLIAINYKKKKKKSKGIKRRGVRNVYTTMCVVTREREKRMKRGDSHLPLGGCKSKTALFSLRLSGKVSIL
jgi:hypothetical protein